MSIPEPRTLEDLCQAKIDEHRKRAKSYQGTLDYWENYLERYYRGEITLKPRHNLQEYTEGFDVSRAIKQRDKCREVVETSAAESLHWEAQLARLEAIPPAEAGPKTRVDLVTGECWVL